MCLSEKQMRELLQSCNQSFIIIIIIIIILSFEWLGSIATKMSSGNTVINEVLYVDPSYH